MAVIQTCKLKSSWFNNNSRMGVSSRLNLDLTEVFLSMEILFPGYHL